MVNITVMNDAQLQEVLLLEGTPPSKESFMQILSKNPTALRIVLQKTQDKHPT